MSRLEDIRNAAKAATRQDGQKQDAETAGAEILELPRAKDLYQAFGSPTQDAQTRLIIYTSKEFFMPRYDLLYDVVSTGLYEFIGLVFPHQRVRIYGRNLSDLFYSLRTNSVEWIRVYNEAFFELPDDPDGTLPVVTEILVDQESPFTQDLEGNGGGNG